MNAPPPLPPRPASSPATPPPAPAPSAPIRDFEGLYRELVAALAPVSIPAPPAMPSAPPSDALAASLLPINQEQLEILQRAEAVLQRAEAERTNRIEKEKNDREWRRTIQYAVAALVVFLEIASQVLRAYLESHYPAHATATPATPTATMIYVTPATAPPPPPPGAR